MEIEQKKEQAVPPYISFRTFSSAIDSLAEHGVPAKIDRSVLNRYSGSVQSQLMSVFRFFSFTNKDDSTTSIFHDYAKASPEEKKEKLDKLLRNHFPNQIKNLHDGTIQQLSDSFKDTKIKPSVKEKCIAFFLKASQEAGLDISSHILRGSRAMPQKDAITKRKRKVSKVKKRKDEDQVQEGFEKTEGTSIIPIPLGSNKVWHIQVNDEHNNEDVERFTQIIKIILGGK